MLDVGYSVFSSSSSASSSSPAGSATAPIYAAHDKGIDVAVIISTDKGLCGGLNHNLFKEVILWQKAHNNSQLVVVGRKAAAFARAYGLNVHAQFTDLPDSIKLNEFS